MARQKVKRELWEQLVVNVGIPGDMVTGSALQAFSSDHVRKITCNLVVDNLHNDLREILIGLSAVAKVINSQKQKVNVHMLRELTRTVNTKIVESF